MQIPKYIDDLISKRRKLANQLFTVCMEIDEWLEKQGIDINEGMFNDCTNNSVMIFAEPAEAERILREQLELFIKDRPINKKEDDLDE